MSNVTCDPINIQGITPHNLNIAYIPSQWNNVSVSAMTACCAPADAKQNGCFTWCPIGDKPPVVDAWKTTFQTCLQKAGARIGGDNYTAPSPVVVLAETAAATTATPAFGLKGALVVALGVTTWMLA